MFFLHSMLDMHNTSKLLSKKVFITNELGLHARPAAMIAKLAKSAKSKVWIVKDDEAVDASSIVDILTIACSAGSKVIVKIEDKSDMDILQSIAKLVETGFEEKIKNA